jgi:hypothetical protein
MRNSPPAAKSPLEKPRNYRENDELTHPPIKKHRFGYVNYDAEARPKFIFPAFSRFFPLNFSTFGLTLSRATAYYPRKKPSCNISASETFTYWAGQ